MLDSILSDDPITLETLIRKGQPRPDESKMQIVCRSFTDTSIRYLKSLGIQVRICSYETVQVFPELLNMLKTCQFLKNFYNKRTCGYDVTQIPAILPSVQLCRYALEHRPDLSSKVAELVIRNNYSDLYEEFESIPEDLNVARAFEHSDTPTIQYWMNKWRCPASYFYPALVDNELTSIILDFVSPELLLFIVEKWKGPRYDNGVVLSAIPKSCAAKALRVLINNPSRNAIKMFSEIFESVRAFKKEHGIFADFEDPKVREAFEQACNLAIEKYDE